MKINAYRNTLGDLRIVLIRDIRQREYVFANELNRSVTHSGRVVQQVAFNRSLNFGLYCISIAKTVQSTHIPKK